MLLEPVNDHRQGEEEQVKHHRREHGYPYVYQQEDVDHAAVRKNRCLSVMDLSCGLDVIIMMMRGASCERQ